MVVGVVDFGVSSQVSAGAFLFVGVLPAFCMFLLFFSGRYVTAASMSASSGGVEARYARCDYFTFFLREKS